MNSNTKYFVAGQWLRIHGNTEHFYIADSYIKDDNKKGQYCYVSMAKAVTRTRHNVTLYYVACPVEVLPCVQKVAVHLHKEHRTSRSAESVCE